jgi:hypothetical protein
MNLWLHTNRKRGQSIVIVALSATALFGIIALGMDAGRLYFQRRDVQNAADAGALAGAQELIPNADTTTPTSTMQAKANYQASWYALKNLNLPLRDSTCCAAYTPNGTGYIIEPSLDGSAKVQVWTPSRGNVNEIHVRVFYNVPLTFAAIMGFTQSTVVADAFAHGGFYNKTYTVFGFDAGGNGNSVNYDQKGNTQIDDGANGSDICQPSGVNGRLVSNAKWHAPNPGGGWMNLNGEFFYAQASDTHALIMYWYKNVSTGITIEPTPNYEPAPNPGGAQPTPDIVLKNGGTHSYPNGDFIRNNTSVDWYVYSPGWYQTTLNLTGNNYYIFRNGIYYFTSGGINVSGGAVVANTSDGMPHYGPYGGITDLNPAADGTNGVTFVLDGTSNASFTSSATASPSVFLVAPTFVPAGTDSIVFFIAATNAASGPGNNSTPWVEQIDGTKAPAGGYPFQIWGSIFNADTNGSEGTGIVLQAVNDSTIAPIRYAVTGEVVSPTVDLDGGNLVNASYTPSNPGTPPACDPSKYVQNPAGMLVQFNQHYVPHFRGLAFLVR